jgi:hypothetical protein
MHVPFTEKQPVRMLTPLAIVVEPVFEILKSVVVADAVEEEMRKAVVFGLEVLSESVRSAYGDVVPMPTLPQILRTARNHCPRDLKHY